MRSLLRVAFVLSCVCHLAPLARAAEGPMLIVTADPGKIMAGEKVLAEVPPGTRLWAFKRAGAYSEVKVPDGDEHGWILLASTKDFQLTGPQQAERQQAAAYFAKAHEQLQAQQFAAARASLEQVLAIERRLYDEHPQLAATLTYLGGLANELSDNAAARKYYDEALAIQRKVQGNLNPDTAGTLNNLGILVHDQGDYTAARKFYDEALAIRRKVLGNENIETGRTLNNLGALAYDQNDYAAARQFYEEALVIKRKVLGNGHPDTAGSLSNLGVVLRTQGDYTTARRYYDEALAIKRKALGNDNVSTANTLNSLGNLCSNQGDYAAARKFYHEALAIYRKILGNDNPSTAGVLNSLGIIACDQKEFPAARKYCEEALAINRKVLGNEHANTANSLNNLGYLSRAQDEFANAKKYCDEALAIQRKVLGNENISTASTLVNLGLIHWKQSDYAAAQKYYAEALAIYRKVLGDEHPDTALTLNNMGLAAAENKDFAAATSYYDQARARVALHVHKTLPSLSAAEQTAFLENTYAEYWTTSLSLSTALREQQALLATSIDWLLNGKAVAQEALAARELLLRDATNPVTAPIVTELQTVRKSLAALTLAAPKPEQAAARQKQLLELTEREEVLSRQLALATGGARATNSWIHLDEVRQALPAKALYVDLVRMKVYDFASKQESAPKYLAWLIPAQGSGQPQVLDLGDADAIDAAVERVRTQLAAAAKPDGVLRTEGEEKATQQLQTDLQAIARLVLEPWREQLPAGAPLILAPDGALWLLPWAALPTKGGKTLLEEHSLRLVLSGRDLLPRPANKLALSAPAIVVNPDYDLIGAAAKAAIKAVLPKFKIDENATRGETSRSSLPRVAALPFTSLEGAAAKPSLEQLAQSEPVLYEQDKALEAVVKTIQRPKDLLIATHGFFLPDQEVKHDGKSDSFTSGEGNRSPTVAITTDGKTVENPLLRCGLLLAGCNAPRTPGLDDGILTGMEIVGMDLRGTELVVLSACETGIGKVRNGEGVAGLRQAFQLAGAQSVVSTLWQVPDRDSALIMQDFFANLAAGQSKADALRNAQLKRIAARKEKSGAAHPFYWAAWTVTGE